MRKDSLPQRRSSSRPAYPQPAHMGLHKSKLFLGGLCVITDTRISGMTAEEMVGGVLKAGARWIQYRDKGATRREMYRIAARLRELTLGFGAAFVVNDFADIALAVDADGVHLGQDDLPLREARAIMGKRIIGISTHSLNEAMEAERGGADYIGYGPVFSTSTKEAGEPKGLDMLAEIKRRVRIPVVAIGGINPGNLPRVVNSGVEAVAAASAIVKGNMRQNVRSFMKVLEGGSSD